MQQRKRKYNRLKYFDYATENAYFITICAKDRICWFGKIFEENILLNTFGKIVEKCWFNLPNHYHNCILDEFIIMPNHIHGIIFIDNNLVREGLRPSPTENLPAKIHGLPEIVRACKSFSSRRINEIILKKNDMKILKFQWQRSFHDHIIRDEKELENIRNYIINNPVNWQTDSEYNMIYTPVGEGLRPSPNQTNLRGQIKI